MGKGFFSTGDSDSDYEDEEFASNGDTDAIGTREGPSGAAKGTTDPEPDHDDTDSPPANTDDRIRRKLFKRHTKQVNKLRKLEVRMQRAAFRNERDHATEARKAWEEFTEELRRDPHSVLNWNTDGDDDGTLNDNHHQFRSVNCQVGQKPEFRHLHHGSVRTLEQQETPGVRAARPWILNIREATVNDMLAKHELRHQNQGGDARLSKNDLASCAAARDRKHRVQDPNHLTSKEQQTLRARALKSHMHKGTQTAAMFRDDLALLGYTRQKFYERASLAFGALDRLDPSCSENNDEEDTNENGQEPATSRLRKTMWERLMSTREVVSLGCGPGCDAVGVLAFLRHHGVRPSRGMVLLDFVMDAWKELVLDKSLIPLLVPECVPSVRTVACDVTKPLLPPEGGDHGDGGPNRAAYAALTEGSVGHKLVVVSYLLTETRGKWKAFVRDLLGLLQTTESLLLLAEPNAWQLHELLRCFGTSSSTEDGLLVRAHAWLDASRDLPHLQALDARSGPAALLVMPN